MSEKICLKCKTNKSIHEFNASRYCKDGKHNWCKKCTRERNQVYSIKRVSKIYDEKSRMCRDCHSILDISQFDKHPDCNNGRMPYCKKCRSIRRNGNSIRQPQPITEEMKHDASIRARNLKRKNHKIYLQDPKYVLTRQLRSRARGAINGFKSCNDLELLGCSIEFFKEWIESQFVDGMSWKNRKDFHIDHVRPCASYDLTDPVDQKQCFSWRNSRPLWAKENLHKTDKVDWKEIASFRQKADNYIIKYFNKARRCRDYKLVGGS